MPTKFFFVFGLYFLGNILFLRSQENICKSIPELEKEAWEKNQSVLKTAALNNYNIVYHRCYWEIDPAVKFIKGNIVTFFKPIASALSNLEFDLSDSLVVDSVLYHNTKIPFSRLQPELLKITFPISIQANTLDSVTVFYKGAPAGNGFGSFAKSTHKGAPVLWTLSEPYGAKTWWPCKQNLSDKIDSLDIYVNVPEGNRAASNGLLVSEIKQGANKVYHWKSRYPIVTYLVAIAVTNYSVYSDFVALKTGTLEVLNYVYPESLDFAMNSTKQLIPIMQLFDSLLIPYPFAKEKYGHAQFGWGGGIEHQTMSFVGGFYLSLLVHEYAHQWFGDDVTCGSWEDIWLNEGFATFFEWLSTERTQNEAWRTSLSSLVKGLTAQPGGSVLCDDTSSASRIFDGRLTYGKGAFLLRMLRYKIGEKNFYAALRNYLKDPNLQGGFAKTPQLKAHLESASGQNLTRFFDQWYYKQGHPSYKVKWLQTGTVLSTTITQTQSHPSVSFFEMPVPINFQGLEGDSTIVFDHRFSGQVFNIDMPFKVTQAFFDPEFHLLAANNQISTIYDLQKANIKLYPNPINTNFILEGFPAGTILEKLEIFNALSLLVYKRQNTIIINDVLPVDVENLEQGVYLLRATTNLGSVVLRFLKN